MSLVLDTTGTLHFDARKPSGLELLLAEYDFQGNPALLDRARRCLDVLRSRGISKYNLGGLPSGIEIYDRWGAAPRGKKRILVLGQVETDASIRYGAPARSDNGRIVWEARKR